MFTIDELTRLDGRAAVLGAAGDTTYTRMMTSDEVPTYGYAADDALLWVSRGPWGPLIASLGRRAGRLLATLYSADQLGGTSWVHVPPLPVAELAPVPVHLTDRWQFRWLTDRLPAEVRYEDAVVELGEPDHAAIEALLDAGHPTSSSRPGQPDVRRWYGIRDRAENRLVACGADRSCNGVGFLVAITVAADRRGTGFGAAITAAMSRALAAEFDAVALGVEADNHRAIRLYERLGFTGALPRASYRILRSRA